MSSTKISSLESASLAPLARLSDQTHRSHAVQFYSEDSFLLDELSRFIGTALDAQGSAIVIATKTHRDGLEHRLKVRGVDTAPAVEQGRYVSLDAAETLSKFMMEGYPDETSFREVIGSCVDRATSSTGGENRRVVAFGEMVALLWGEGKADAAIRLEQLWNSLAETHSFSLRCAYPMTGFHREEHDEPFLKICAEHSDVIPTDSYTTLTGNEERLRNIARLQQKEQVYEELRRTKNRLEKEITERMEAERKLRDSEASLRQLSGRLLRMQDEERRHLGRELHDSVGQYLAVVKMGLDQLNSDGEVNGNAAGRQVVDCLHLVEKSIREVRTMSYLLYPPMLEEMGLQTAIPWYLEGFAKRSGIQTTLEITDTFGRLPRDVELAIFRVLQESLTNVHRHSGSSTAHIRVLTENEMVRVEIKDRGKGIPPALLESTRDALGTLGVGLRGMSERMRQLGGTLELFSTDTGTTVCASVPCNATPSDEDLSA